MQSNAERSKSNQVPTQNVEQEMLIIFKSTDMQQCICIPCILHLWMIAPKTLWSYFVYCDIGLLFIQSINLLHEFPVFARPSISYKQLAANKRWLKLCFKTLKYTSNFFWSELWMIFNLHWFNCYWLFSVFAQTSILNISLQRGASLNFVTHAR